MKEEARSFDRHATNRLTHGFIPDIQRLKKVPYFYNNPWREPEFFNIQIKPRIDFILNAVRKRKGKVIEFGCGSGFLSLEMAREGCDVLGQDISPKSIAIARDYAKHAKKGKQFGSLNYAVSNMEIMDLPKESFDSAAFLGSLHHIAHPTKLLSRVWRSLKKGGNLVICEPVRENVNSYSALIAGILRLTAPTWESYPAKLNGKNSEKNLKWYFQDIFDEYTYLNEHQSPNDNLTASEEIMISAIKKFFTIKKIEHADAFIDKLIGGLRGPHRYALAQTLKVVDDYAVKNKLLPPTTIHVWAIKK